MGRQGTSHPTYTYLHVTTYTYLHITTPTSTYSTARNMAEVRKKGRKVVGSGYGSPRRATSNSKRDGPYNALAKVQQKMAINRKGRRARQPSFKMPNQIQTKSKKESNLRTGDCKVDGRRLRGNSRR